MLEYLCDCFFTCCVRINTIIYITLTLCYPACAHHRKTQSVCWPSVLITLMAVADYFGLHCCRPAAFMQQVCRGVGDTGTGSGTRAHARTRAGIRHAHGFRCSSTASWMEWRPARRSVCLPLLIFPCTIKSRSSLLALPDPGGPGKRPAKRLWWW